MTTREKAGLIVMFWMLKILDPFKHNFHFDEFKREFWDAMKQGKDGETQ